MITPMSFLLGIIHIGTALILIAFATALYRGWLPRGGVYFSMIHSLESEADMILASRYIGRQYILWSLFYLVAGIVVLFYELGDYDPLIPWFAFGPLIFLIIPGARSYFYARKLKERQ